MKPTALLAVAIFLICAPSPDSRTLSEMSGGFLSHLEVEPLLAANTSLPIETYNPEKSHRSLDHENGDISSTAD